MGTFRLNHLPNLGSDVGTILTRVFYLSWPRWRSVSNSSVQWWKKKKLGSSLRIRPSGKCAESTQSKGFRSRCDKKFAKAPRKFPWPMTPIVWTIGPGDGPVQAMTGICPWIAVGMHVCEKLDSCESLTFAWPSNTDDHKKLEHDYLASLVVYSLLRIYKANDQPYEFNMQRTFKEGRTDALPLSDAAL